MSLLPVAALAIRLGDPDRPDPRLRVVDTRWYLGRPGEGRRAYEAAHIPGAIHLDLEADLSAPSGPDHVGGLGRHPLPTAAEFRARLEAVGIGDDALVVAYDDAGGGVAARLWWMLDALGHRAVALLDGGWQGWLAAGQPTATRVPSWPPARLSLAATWPRTIERAALAEALGSVVLLDVRAGERYRGEVEPVDPAAGHIPTAISAPIAGNIGPEGRFLGPQALRARFADLGVTAGGAPEAEHGSGPSGLEPPVVVSCGSGTNACQAALAMRVAGLSDPLLYVGSFSDWSRARGPVVAGAAPGIQPAAGTTVRS